MPTVIRQKSQRVADLPRDTFTLRGVTVNVLDVQYIAFSYLRRAVYCIQLLETCSILHSVT